MKNTAWEDFVENQRDGLRDMKRTHIMEDLIADGMEPNDAFNLAMEKMEKAAHDKEAI